MTCINAQNQLVLLFSRQFSKEKLVNLSLSSDPAEQS